MSGPNRSKESILAKLGIASLNEMQEAAHEAILSKSEVILLSPTGTGKTLAFLLPIIERLDPEVNGIQALIIAPSRELAIQIEQVARTIGSGYKVNAVYGGRAGSQDKIDLKKPPAILIGTPGRIADHIRRETITTYDIKTLVLDEFDKSLEIGFETEMQEICDSLFEVERKILTSATQEVEIPSFVALSKPTYVNFLKDGVAQLSLKAIISPDKDKMKTLVKALCHIGDQPGIIFCNFKDTIERIGEYLEDNGISHGVFHGGMEQRDRELALLKFRNGTHRLILATDLAARGIDVPEIKFIIHYHLPLRSQEFTHRNGRTARMNSDGTAYVLHWEKEELPDFIEPLEEEKLSNAGAPKFPIWRTLHITGGRRDKISKGDIAGLFFKQGKLNKDELGIIELKQDAAFVGVHASAVDQVIPLVNNSRLKKKKVRVSVI